ncbi:signal transduction histidine kinase [Nocardiopsis sp. L17-MgMaSL7]|nr:signal transduction histidine kinase [Nocardiopsis sp. L17-MgMaSL7]
MLVVLLVVDFELGARLLVGESGGEVVAAGLSTALVAIVVAVLALARMSLPPRVTVTSAFVVSLLASAISAAAGTPLLALTESAALMVITVLGLRESSPRGAVIVGAVALVVTVAAVSRLSFDATVVLLALLAWGCVIAVGIAGRYLTMRRESALEAARRAERMELARELHDVVAHQITGIVVQAQAALTVARTDPESVAEGFSAIESAGTEALAGMRRMVGAIRDEADPGAPLTVAYGLADIPDLVDRFDPGRQRTTLRLEATDSPVPPGIGESAYRVVREALTNVRRHAPEGFTRVSVRAIDSELVIQIGNDGVRARSINSGSSGFGLIGMAERVDTLGGKMRAGPDESDSWSVWVSLPLEAVT